MAQMRHREKILDFSEVLLIVITNQLFGHGNAAAVRVVRVEEDISIPATCNSLQTHSKDV
jgi:hypothetical protein